MKEISQSVVEMSLFDPPNRILGVLEREVKKHWEKGWVFIRAEPDRLLESVRLHFERSHSIE